MGAILNLPLEKVTKEGNGPEGILIVRIDIVSPLASNVLGNVYDKTEFTRTAWSVNTALKIGATFGGGAVTVIVNENEFVVFVSSRITLTVVVPS